MGEVINLFKKKNMHKEEMTDRVVELLAMIENDEIEHFIVAAVNGDGDILTGYSNNDLSERQNLLSHMQIDINTEVVINYLKDGDANG